jgi:hypothetical protein
MKKLLLLALLLMPTMTLARESIDLPAQAITEPIYAPAPEATPTPSPTPSPSIGGGGFTDNSPRVTSRIIQQEWLPATTYQFLTGQFGFAYFESITGERIYEMDYCTYHTIDTKGAGTIYFVQIDSNGYEHKALKVLEIE